MTVIGYARVSTDGQHLSAQRAALKAAGAAKVFEEKESGVISGRKQLAKAVAALDAGESQIAMARTFNVNQATISRLVNR